MSRSKRKIDFRKQRSKKYLAMQTNATHMKLATPSRITRPISTREWRLSWHFPWKPSRLSAYTSYGCHSKEEFLLPVKNGIYSFLRRYSLFFKTFFLNERSHLDCYLDVKIRFREKLSIWRYTVTLKLWNITYKSLPGLRLNSQYLLTLYAGHYVQSS